MSHKGQVQTLPEDPELRSTYSGGIRTEGVKPVWGKELWRSELGADPEVPPFRPYLEGVGAGEGMLRLLSQLRQVRGLKPGVWDLFEGKGLSSDSGKVGKGSQEARSRVSKGVEPAARNLPT